VAHVMSLPHKPLHILTYIAVSSRRLESRIGSIATIVASATLNNALVYANRRALAAFNTKIITIRICAECG
jgi:hypothetical protein